MESTASATVTYIDMQCAPTMRCKISDYLPEIMLAPQGSQELIHVDKDFSAFKFVRKPECKTLTSFVSDDLEALRSLGVRLKDVFLEVGDVCFDNLVFLFASQLTDKSCPHADKLVMLHFSAFNCILSLCELTNETKVQQHPKLIDTELVCLPSDDFLARHTGCNLISMGARYGKAA